MRIRKSNHCKERQHLSLVEYSSRQLAKELIERCDGGVIALKTRGEGEAEMIIAVCQEDVTRSYGLATIALKTAEDCLEDFMDRKMS